jgi:hypothetical protein
MVCSYKLDNLFLSIAHHCVSLQTNLRKLDLFPSSGSRRGRLLLILTNSVQMGDTVDQKMFAFSWDALYNTTP